MTIANALRALLDAGRFTQEGHFTVNSKELATLHGQARAALAAHDAATTSVDAVETLHVAQPATDTPDNPGAELPAVIGDRFGTVATLSLRGTAQGDNERAARIVACVNACEGVTDPSRLVPALRACEDLLSELADGGAENPELAIVREALS